MTNRGLRFYRPVFVLMLLVCLSGGGWVLAQEGEVTEAVEAPTDVPLIPTEAPVIPSEMPSPTETLFPTEEATIAPTDAPTETALPIETLSPTLTETPFITATPYLDPETGKSLDLVVVDLGIAALAAEDLFANAHPINSVPFTDVDDTTGSGVEVGEVSPTCGFNITSTVWYAFTPPAAGRYLINTAGSTFDTLLAVYRGASLGDLQEVACNDDASRVDLTSAVTVDVSNTDTLYIQLGGYNGHYGLYQMNVQAVGVAIPQPVTPAQPANATLTNNNQILLGWNPPLRGAVPDYYHVQVATDARFLNIVHDERVTQPNATVGPLADGLYYWRVASQNINGQAARFSTVWRFTVDTTPPDAPSLVLPAEGGGIPQVRPRLTWSRPLTANRYWVEIARDAAFTDLVPLTNSESAANALVLSAAILPTPLEQGIYYWRVAARDAALNWSAPSETGTFTVNLSNTPAAGQVFVAPVRTGLANVTVTWLAAGFVGAQYRVELATDAAFTEIVATSPTIPQVRYAFTNLAPNIYYWRVLVNEVAPPDGVSRHFSVSSPAPPRLVPTGPSNLFLSDQTDVLLSWNPTDAALTGGPFTYEVQVGRDARFTPQSLVFDGWGLTDPQQQLSGLADGLYFWRVRPVNVFNSAGAWSAAWRFTVDTTPPDAPVLATPLTGQRLNLATPTLVWRPAATANFYRLEVATTATFDELMVTQELAARQFRLPALAAQGTYYWRVAARDAAGNWGAFSDVWAFTYGLPTTPAHNLFSVSQRPAFAWAAMTGAQRYRLMVYAAGDFGTPLIEFATVDARTRVYRLTENLPYGTYEWWVDVDLGAGWEQSPVHSVFTITPRALARTVLTGPTHNSFTRDTAPIFQWNAVTDPDGNAVRYEIQLSANARFTPLSHTAIVSETQYSPNMALNDGRYYWRVRAINIYDGPGAWSAAYLVNVDTVAPAVPVLRTPLHATVSVNPRQAFVWNPSVGAQRYEIRLGVENPPETVINVAAARQYAPPSPLLFTTYYWQVRAVDAAGNVSDWSAVQSLKIEAATNQRITLNRFESATPTLSWSPVSWATAYELVVANNARFTMPHYQNSAIDPDERSYTLTTPLPNGTYSWRVRAQRANGTWGGWSSIGTFTVEN